MLRIQRESSPFYYRALHPFDCIGRLRNPTAKHLNHGQSKTAAKRTRLSEQFPQHDIRTLSSEHSCPACAHEEVRPLKNVCVTFDAVVGKFYVLGGEFRSRVVGTRSPRDAYRGSAHTRGRWVGVTLRSAQLRRRRGVSPPPAR